MDKKPIEEAQTATLEMPTIEIPQTNQSILSRLSNFVQDTVFIDEEIKPKRKKQGNLKKQVPMLCALLITGLSYIVDDLYQELLPTDKEMQAVLLPLFKIIDRHITITGNVSPDVEDMLAMITAIVGYGFNARVRYMELKNREVQENEK